jgi:GTP-binding protein LepA
MEADLEIIPVINKIDLAAADVAKVSNEIISLLGCKKEDILLVSAKTGQGVGKVLDAIIEKVPRPHGSTDQPARALIFDSQYDEYRGVVLYIRMVDGKIAKNSQISLMATGTTGVALEVGSLTPDHKPAGSLSAGEIGYVVTNFHSVHEAKVGDTLTLQDQPAKKPLPGYREVKPFVYAGFFPSSSEQYPDLKDALEKLELNDSALSYSAENSQVLGFGFRVGFLGMLHMEIVRERLEREYGLDLIITNPSTDYKIIMLSGKEIIIRNAADLPDPAIITEIKEPWIKGEIVCPKQYVGPIIQLIASTRGSQKDVNYLDEQLALINFEAPMANLLINFYDQLKSATSGYGSFNYELGDYRPEDLVKLDFLVAGDIVDSLSVMVHRSEADKIGRETVKKLRQAIPKQLFQVSLQAAIGSRIIARENISALKKDVTGHLYGGDVSRKKKLWAKQKRGKTRMRKFGKVEIPAEAFMVMLKRD